MQDIWLLCGVPGSGKSWVCRQLTQRFNYIPHDEHITPGQRGVSPIEKHKFALIYAAKEGMKPVIGECPFMMSVMIEELRKLGATVHPVFVLEPAHVIKERYEKRENKPIPQQHLTRVNSIAGDARKYGEYSGSSGDVLAYMSRQGLIAQPAAHRFPTLKVIK